MGQGRRQGRGAMHGMGGRWNQGTTPLMNQPSPITPGGYRLQDAGACIQQVNPPIPAQPVSVPPAVSTDTSSASSVSVSVPIISAPSAPAAGAAEVPAAQPVTE
jgi:hypothetical protein